MWAVKAPMVQMRRSRQLDIAKSVFQVHGVDAGGEVVIRRQLKRRHVLALRRSDAGDRSRRECC
jgi:hypothetical protein